MFNAVRLKADTNKSKYKLSLFWMKPKGPRFKQKIVVSLTRRDLGPLKLISMTQGRKQETCRNRGMNSGIKMLILRQSYVIVKGLS